MATLKFYDLFKSTVGFRATFGWNFWRRIHFWAARASLDDFEGAILSVGFRFCALKIPKCLKRFEPNFFSQVSAAFYWSTSKFWYWWHSSLRYRPPKWAWTRTRHAGYPHQWMSVFSGSRRAGTKVCLQLLIVFEKRRKWCAKLCQIPILQKKIFQYFHENANFAPRAASFNL